MSFKAPKDPSGGGFSRLGPGWHRVKITDLGDGFNKNPRITFGNSGGEVRHNLPAPGALTEKNVWKLHRLAGACNYPSADFWSLDVSERTNEPDWADVWTVVKGAVEALGDDEILIKLEPRSFINQEGESTQYLDIRAMHTLSGRDDRRIAGNDPGPDGSYNIEMEAPAPAQAATTESTETPF